MVIFARRGLTLGLFAKGMLKLERDRVKGMLWGLVVGDCLESPVQFSGKDDQSADHGDDAVLQVLYPAQLLNG